MFVAAKTTAAVRMIQCFVVQYLLAAAAAAATTAAVSQLCEISVGKDSNSKLEKNIIMYAIHDLPAGRVAFTAANLGVGTGSTSVGVKSLPR